jgi:hypothetical protein
MLGVYDFNTLEFSYLREEWNSLIEISQNEFLNKINKEIIKNFSKSLLLYLSEKLEMDVYRLELKNVATLDFIVNDREEINLNELTKFKSFSSSTHVAKVFPHIFSLSEDYDFIGRNTKFYKNVFKKNNLKGLQYFIEGKKDVKLDYVDIIYLLIFLKLNGIIKQYLNDLKKPLTIVIDMGIEIRKQFDNILYLVSDTSIDEVINTLVFQGKYLTETPKKGEFIVYNYKGKDIIIPLDNINNLLESKYRIRFTTPSYL